MVTASQVASLRVPQLKKHLKARGLDATGKKLDLVVRLSMALASEGKKTKKKKGKKAMKKAVDSSEDEQEDEEEGEGEEEEEGGITNASGQVILWQWAGDSKNGGSQDVWINYDLPMATKLEKAYQKCKAKGKMGNVKCCTTRFVDLKLMVQKRYDDHNRMRGVQRLVDGVVDVGGEIDADDDDEEEEEEEEEENDWEVDDDDDDDDDDDKDEEEDEHAAWFWAGDSQPNGHQDQWVRYSKQLERRLDKAWAQSKKKVRVDAQRFVDLPNMLQRRYDDPNRCRMMKRVDPDEDEDSLLEKEEEEEDEVGNEEEDEDEKKKKKKKVKSKKRTASSVAASTAAAKKQKTKKNDKDEDGVDQDEDGAKPTLDKRTSLGSSILSLIEAPDTWENQRNMKYREEPVDPNSKEFKALAKGFVGTIAGYHKNSQQNHKVLFTKFKVTRIVRVQNPAQWQRYMARKSELEQNAPYPKVKKVLNGKSLDEDMNEFHLYHGLNMSFVAGITKFGFDPRHCSLQGMFGAGLYFAENSSKANQYVHSHNCAISGPGYKPACKCSNQDENCMLVCRVTLADCLTEVKFRGNAPGQYWHNKRTEPLKPDGSKYNSVLGESRKNAGNWAGLELREYIIYESSQVYPEYKLFYKRVP